jgi:hypothetical protein
MQVFKLMSPHWEFTLALNANGRGGLISAGGIIESTFTPGEYGMSVSTEDAEPKNRTITRLVVFVGCNLRVSCRPGQAAVGQSNVRNMLVERSETYGSGQLTDLTIAASELIVNSQRH